MRRRGKLSQNIKPVKTAGLHASSKTLFIMLGVTVLAVIILLLYQIRLSYRESILEAETKTRNYSAILEARLDATLRRTDAILQRFVNSIPAAAMSQHAVSRFENQLNGELDSHLVNFDELAGVRVFDVSGDLLYTWARATTPRTNIADRSYFRQLRDNPQAGLVFSEVIISRATGRQSMVAARALYDGQGTFLGIVSAVLELGYFQKLFQSLDIGPKGLITIRRSDDFTQVVRWPAMDSENNKSLPPDHPSRAAIKAGKQQATFEVSAATDGVVRIFSIHRLNRFPFYVQSALARDDVLASWRTRSLAFAGSGLLLLGFAASVLMRLWRSESHEIQATADLEESERRLRYLVATSPVTIYTCRPSGDFGATFISTNVNRLLGYEADEFTQSPHFWADHIHPDDRERVFSGLSALFDHGNHSHEYRFLKQDGTYRWMHDELSLSRTVDGEPLEIIGCWADITDRKLLELKRDEDQRFLQTILDSITDLVFYKDRNGVYQGCNEAYASRYIGLPKERIIGHTDYDFIPDTFQVEKYVQSDRQVMESRRPMVIESWITLSNGQKSLVEVLKTPFYDVSDQVAGVIGVARDITEHHRALEAITSEKETAQRYLDIAGVMFCALNRAGEIILINRKGSHLLGYGDDELLGRNWFDTCLPESVRERVKGVFALQLAGNLAPVEFYENTIINKNGEERLIAFHNTLLHDERGVSGVLFSGEDITDQRKMQGELLKSQKMESLGVLAGGIAHDFNNILTGIMGNISFAQMFLDATHKSHKPLIEAEKASLRATELAQQLLTFARGGEPIKSVVSVQHLVDESVSLVLRGTNIKGVVDIPDSIHAIDADEGQISQVFHNIIINATQAMPGGGVLNVFARNEEVDPVNTLMLQAGNYVRISFSDEGCGIPEDNLKRIFDPYFTTKSAGNGLGLASAHSIVSRHGGNIAVTSAPGIGTTFTIYLPSIGETFSRHQTARTTQSAGDHAGGSVLVMDDEEMIRDLASEILKYLGYQVTTCADGDEAILLYRTAMESGEPFHAAIMDLTIPGGVGGMEAARQIRAIDPEACLIVSSGYSNDQILAEYEAHGFSGVVAKPYTVSELGQVLGSLLAKR
jgi:PAS domain S-box-containing protein